METETRFTPGVEGGDKNPIPEDSFAIAKANSEEPNRTDAAAHAGHPTPFLPCVITSASGSTRISTGLCGRRT